MASRSPAAPLPPPGGTRTLLSAALVNAAAGTLFAWSVLLAPLETDLSARPAELAPVFSCALVLFATAVLAAGGLVDRQGPRRTVVLAAVLCAAGSAVAATARSVLVLGLGLGVLFGLGSGLAYLSAVTTSSTQRSRWPGTAAALVVAAYAAGPLVAAPVLAEGVDGPGWRAALWGAALVVPLLLLVGARGLPDRGAPREPPARSTRPATPRGLWWLWLLFLCAVTPALFAFAFATDIALEHDADGSGGSGAVAVMAGGNLGGRLLAGPLSDGLGLRRALRLVLLALPVALATLAWPVGDHAVLLGLLLLAAQYGAVSALLPLATARVAPAQLFASSYGRVFTSWGVAGVAGPVLGGRLHDLSGGHVVAFRAALLVAALAWLALWRYERAARARA